MNPYLKDVIWEECNKANHFLRIPGIYKHFKEKIDGEDMWYCVTNVSEPLQPKDMLKLVTDTKHKIITAFHTELNANTWIFRVQDRYYHPATIEPKTVVLYTALYGDRKTYVRPLDMFLSTVDKDKYPNANQKFRFELITGI